MWNIPIIVAALGLGAVGTDALLRSLVKKYISEDVEIKVHDLELIAQGMMEGAMHYEGLDDIVACIEEPGTVVADIKSAMTNFSEKDREHIFQGIKDLGQAFNDIVKGVKECHKLDAREIKVLTTLVAELHDPKSVIINAGVNILVSG